MGHAYLKDVFNSIDNFSSLKLFFEIETWSRATIQNHQSQTFSTTLTLNVLTISRWNSLRQNTVDATPITVFKTRLDKLRVAYTRWVYLWIIRPLGLEAIGLSDHSGAPDLVSYLVSYFYKLR